MDSRNCSISAPNISSVLRHGISCWPGHCDHVNQRRLLAVKAHAIGCKTLRELTTVLTPDCSVANTRAKKSQRLQETAGIVVKANPRTVVKDFASAQDLRRSFGERWAGRVEAQYLPQLMRHSSIQTTAFLHEARCGNTRSENRRSLSAVSFGSRGRTIRKPLR